MTNEAAERLLTAMAYEVDPAGYYPGDWFAYHKEQLDLALAAERKEILDELGAWARSHRSLVRGMGNTDDVRGFIEWVAAR